MGKTRWVQISYSPVAAEVGRHVELDADEAARKVSEGRARYLTDDEVQAGTKQSSSAKATPKG